MKRKILLALMSALAVVGLVGVGTGSGTAEAKMEPGYYKAHYMPYGAVPTPIANAHVTKHRYLQDAYGTGLPFWNYELKDTKHGAVASLVNHPASQWYQRIEFRKTKTGYKGVLYSLGGIPLGDVYLRKVR